MTTAPEATNLERWWLLGWLCLVPPLVYVIGGFRQPGFGPPFMITFLYGPGSNHSTIGLFLLLFGKILFPLTAAVAGGWLLARGTPKKAAAWCLLVAGVLLLLLNLATRQPQFPVLGEALPSVLHMDGT